MSFYKAQINFLSNFALIFSAIKYNFLCFFSSNIIYFAQRRPIKAQIVNSSGQNSSNTSCQFRNNKSIPLWILHPVMTNYSPVNLKFGDFQVLWWKFPKFLMSFWKVKVSFSSSFASIFTVIKHNSSVLF